MDQGMAGMGGMQHGPMTPPAHGTGPVMSEGAPLRDLPRLANTATAKGRFGAELT
jgi:bilirubin oxidase